MAERRNASADSAARAHQHWRDADSHRRERPHDPRQPGEIDPTLPQAQRNRFLNTRNGVFYPTGHAVLVLPPDDALALRDALHEAGFGRDETLLLDPQQTADLMGASEEQAGVLNELGGELANATIIRQLADDGSAMLLVRAKGDEAQRKLLRAAAGKGVRKALRYHALAIEELPVGTEDVPGDSPYASGEVPRNKPSDAQLKPRH
ncbi:MAG: hypothetical protein ROZ64_13470 [Burkholderiaceae bacterium]|jgi:hypothetical protein|nr:hypothetical protein [Burkholderiaceae bacterium]